MRLWVYIMCRDEQDILPYTLLHYRDALKAERIIVYDAQSVDRSREICREYGAEVVDWDTGGELNSDIDQQHKSSCWRGTPADWVIVVDTDELIYFPGGLKTLEEHEARGTAVVKPYGWNMFSDVFPTTQGQIYDEVKHGAPNRYWYGKTALFAPKRLQSLRIGHGGHDCQGVLLDGTPFEIPPMTIPSQPPVYLLHCKHLGPVERVAANMELKQSRLAAVNRANGWGRLDCSPLEHVRRQREVILAGLRRVIS